MKHKFKKSNLKNSTNHVSFDLRPRSLTGNLCRVKILKAQPASLQTLIERYSLMQSINDVVVNVGGLPAFEAAYLPMLERFADRVQELPLQRAAFADLGGALTCAVRASTLAVRTCDATIFSPSATAAERLTNDRHYRWLAYCAVLANVYLITSATIDVVHQSGPDTPSKSYSWASDAHLIDWMPSYQMAWVERPQLVLSRLVPFLPPLFFTGQFAHLPRQLIADFGASLNPALAALTAEPPLARVVRQSIEKVIADERASLASWVAQTDAPAPGAQAGSGAPSPATAMPGTGLTPDAAIPAAREVPAAAASETAGEHPHDPSEPQAPKPPAPPPETPAQIKAREWLTGVAANSALEGEATVQADGKLQLSRKALGFGSTPTATFGLLHSAGFAVSKTESSAILNARASEIYKAAVAARKSS